MDKGGVSNKKVGIAFNSLMEELSIKLTTAHIEIIEDLSTRSAQRIMCEIRMYLNKEKHHLVTLEDYRLYRGLNTDFIVARLKGGDMI